MTLQTKRDDDITNKKPQRNIFFKFAISKTYVAICLAEDGTRMGGI